MALLMNPQKEFEAIFTLKSEAPKNSNAIKINCPGTMN